MICSYNTCIVYNGNNSLDVIGDTSLVLVNFGDYSETHDFSSREIIKTEQTMLRPRPNHLGTQYTSVVEFKIGFIKSDREDFTQSEIETITQWLYSPTLPTKLTYISDKWDETRYWKGVFTGITAQRVGSTWGLVAHFVADSPFTYIDTATNTLNVIHTGTINCDTVTTQQDEYIYPIISIVSGATDDVTIAWGNDLSDTLTIGLKRNNATTIDCELLLIKDSAGIISYKDLGVTDPTGVSWPYLSNGVNNIQFTSKDSSTPLEISISYTNRVIGGIPDEFNV